MNVSMESPARKYEVGIRYDGKVLEDDLAFYLLATSGIEQPDLLDRKHKLMSSNWIGFVGIEGRKDGGGLRDIVIAFRGTQVPAAPAGARPALRVFNA